MLNLVVRKVIARLQNVKICIFTVLSLVLRYVQVISNVHTKTLILILWEASWQQHDHKSEYLNKKH